jgi:hypothetical protein
LHSAASAGAGVQIYLLRRSRSTTALSIERPLPSMLMRILLLIVLGAKR